MNLFNYQENSYCQPKKFPFVSSRRLDYNYYPTSIPIPTPTYIANDEVFVWLVHSAVTPNILPYRYLISNYGRMWDHIKNEEKVPCFHSNGYLKTKVLYFKSEVEVAQLDVFMHRIVAFYFLYRPYCELLEVNHISGIKTDNRVCNLEWVTRTENMIHASEHNLIPKGEDKFNAKLSNIQVEEACRLIIGGMNNVEIANIIKTDPKTISAIRCGEVYRSISSRYGIGENKKEIAEKLTDEQAERICTLLIDSTLTLDEICKLVGCTKNQIHSLRFEGRYKHITDKYDMNKIPSRRDINVKVPVEKVNEICRLIEDGFMPADIAKMSGMPDRITIGHIKDGSLYSNISKNYKFPMPKQRNELDKIHKACQLIEQDPNRIAQSIADEVGITIDTVRHLKNKRIYKDIIAQYNIPNPISIEESLSDDKVREICRMIQKYPSMQIRKLSKILNVAEFKISRIKNRKTYTEISKDYIW